MVESIYLTIKNSRAPLHNLVHQNVLGRLKNSWELQKQAKTTVIMMGDFNHTDADWDNCYGKGKEEEEYLKAAILQANEDGDCIRSCFVWIKRFSE